MTRKHFKGHSMLTFYTAPADQEDFDTLSGFDDRTLSSLTATMDGGRPTLPCDGRDEDQPLRTLPLERWRDR